MWGVEACYPQFCASRKLMKGVKDSVLFPVGSLVEIKSVLSCSHNLEPMELLPGDSAAASGRLHHITGRKQKLETTDGGERIWCKSRATVKY